MKIAEHGHSQAFLGAEIEEGAYSLLRTSVGDFFHPLVFGYHPAESVLGGRAVFQFPDGPHGLAGQMPGIFISI